MSVRQTLRAESSRRRNLMENPNETKCGTGNGTLPGTCASLVYPFVAMQENNPPRYDRGEALQTGTLFPGLNLPFHAAMKQKLRTDNTALAELMALDFAVDELGLYLTTHQNDKEALSLYWSYVKLANEGRMKYQKMYGPLLQTDITEDGRFTWLNDPWPWNEGGGK
jgi:spore coat protein JB